MPRVYLDHNATSPMSARVRGVLHGAFERYAGNASSAHREGQAARLALESARERIAKILHVRATEVVFTSGGTESNNAALGAALAVGPRPRGRGPRAIVSAVEHPSILESCRSLQRAGAQITLLRVDGRGVADPEDLRAILDRDGAELVSVMHANNETGVVQPVEEMARISRERGARFHADAAQTLGRIPIGGAVAEADMLSFASHKIGGPAGVGLLVVKEGTPFVPHMNGGAQEGRRRAGTEPVALALAFAEALEVSAGDSGAAADPPLASLRDRIESAVRELDARAVVHGAGAFRLPNTTYFHLPSAPGRIMVMLLDRLGYSISTGAACSTGASRPSHVLEAMGRPASESMDSLRVSLGPDSTEVEIEGFLQALADSAGRLAAAPAPASSTTGAIR